MEPLSQHLRGLLREAVAEAYRRALSRELTTLHEAFERWRRDELTPFQLGEEIHRFHQGPNRELYTRYVGGDPLISAAGAVIDGTLTVDELPSDLRPHVERAVRSLRSPASE